MKREDILTPEVVENFRKHAIECYPEECVGLILKDCGYHPMENIAEDPTRTAKFKMGSYLLHKKNGNLLAFAHSHPNGPHCPSEADMVTQRSMAVPAALISTDGHACAPPFVWGDQLEPLSLIGRGFLHGVTDCYGLIRDYFRIEKGVIIPDFPRNWEWWGKGQDLYSQNFEAAGFYRIEPRELKPGDVVLMSIRSDTTNHGGVVLENGLLLHHLTSTQPWDPSRLSRREPLSRWSKWITHFLRHKG